MRASALLFPLSPIFVFFAIVFHSANASLSRQLGKEEEESGTCTRSKIGIWKGRTWPEAYARCVRGDNGGTYTANLPAAVSNNWLPRQVHIPPIMCISAPCTAMLGPGRTGYRGRYARTFLPSRMYPSPSCLPRKSFNESVIDALSRQALISLSRGFANRYLRNRLGHSDLTESLARVTIGQP